MKDLKIEIERRRCDAELAATAALVHLGICSGEATYAKAVEVYGCWFKAAVKAGKIQPCRYGNNGRVKYFLVADILAVRSLEYEQMQM